MKEYIIVFLLSVAILYALNIALYYGLNKSISKPSRHQQGFRFGITSILVSLPLALAEKELCWHWLILPAFISLIWMITFPLLFHLTNRKIKSDYDNYTDLTFGAYCWGMLCSLYSIAINYPCIMPFISVLEILLLLPCIFQLGYYLIYGVCIDENGMKIVQETHINEIIEFFHSFNAAKVILYFTLGLLAITGIIYSNQMLLNVPNKHLPIWIVGAETILAIFFIYYIIKPKRGALSRTGISNLWLIIKDYSKRNNIYKENQESRLKSLEVTPLVPLDNSRPHTILMVIGESASRDFMSAYSPQPRETTPWLSKMKAEDSKHFIIMPHAYSCANQTVPTLERALTERNQYNDKEFYASCSIIDIAKKLGYATHWYSNQGHLGAADTPITLVAESSDVAKWTKQDFGKVQYDETLLDFLQELDPNKNNFLVVHLKGSHFNFINRYPASYCEAANTPKDDFVEQFRTSLHYTDHILHELFNYCQEHLNLTSMFYFSDHGTLPFGQRSPNFKGFGPVRIPLFVYCSDRFIQEHKERYDALIANKDKYFTNDLAYELACGIMDIKSAHFDPTNSIAYSSYRFTRDMLLTNEGRTHINEDDDSMYTWENISKKINTLTVGNV
ncbi:MAG: phosphoethanolamine transferase [Bacteroidaceae bacterium]|nr:phosphoethanolamine transferase [Bacteroidaceae bacterium]